MGLTYQVGCGRKTVRGDRSNSACDGFLLEGHDSKSLLRVAAKTRIDLVSDNLLFSVSAHSCDWEGHEGRSLGQKL
jgi:hypothetical protein